MKKCLLVFSGLFALMFFANAVPVSLYVGTSNSFSFPIIRGDLHLPLTSFGFAGTSEVGVDVLGWQVGGLFNAALWGSGDGKDGLMKNFMAIQLGLAVNKEFDNSEEDNLLGFEDDKEFDDWDEDFEDDDIE